MLAINFQNLKLLQLVKLCSLLWLIGITVKLVHVFGFIIRPLGVVHGPFFLDSATGFDMADRQI